MMTGHLLHEGVRVPHSHIRASIHRVDPAGVAEKKSKAVKRRVYHVSYPNDVWHIDGNHKLIKWRFVVHGGIDGFSCLIMFLECHCNNRAEIVVTSFQRGPKKIHTDYSGENADVWRYIITSHGNQQCVIVGSSTHNEGIKRLWRDVHHSVLQTFGDIF